MQHFDPPTDTGMGPARSTNKSSSGFDALYDVVLAIALRTPLLSAHPAQYPTRPINCTHPHLLRGRSHHGLVGVCEGVAEIVDADAALPACPHDVPG